MQDCLIKNVTFKWYWIVLCHNKYAFWFFPGEIDTRFSFCAVATLALLVRVHCIVFLQQLVLFKSIKVFHFLKKAVFLYFQGQDGHHKPGQGCGICLVLYELWWWIWLQTWFRVTCWSGELLGFIFNLLFTNAWRLSDYFCAMSPASVLYYRGCLNETYYIFFLCFSHVCLVF